MGSALVSVRGGGRWCHLVVGHLVIVIRSRCRPFLSFVAVHLRSSLSRVVNGFALLALRLAIGDVDGGVVALVGWACVQSWPVVRMGGFRGCSLSFAGRCVLSASLLPLLGGFGLVLGGCSRFRTLGTVWSGGVYATLHGGDMVARRMRVVVGRCVEVVGGVVGVVVAR